MKARVIARLNKRLWPHADNVPLPNPLQPNDIIEITEVVQGTPPLNSTNPTWYKTSGNYYVWSGGVEMEEPAIKALREEAAGTAQSSNTWIQRLGIDKLWPITTGTGVRVGVIDSGIDAQHPDLHGALGVERNFFKPNFPADDFDGHGTHCAGIVAGRGNQRVYGVAPGATLNVAKIFGMTGFGVNETLLLKALEWSFENSDIISLSAGLPAHHQPIADLIDRALANGKILVCAIGNLATNDPAPHGDFPANHPGAISVGSYDDTFALSSFTKRFPDLTISAPGENIVSTYTRKVTAYKAMSGTSMATPFVAGLLALKKSKVGHLDAPGARAFLRNQATAKTAGGFTYYTLSNHPITL